MKDEGLGLDNAPYPKGRAGYCYRDAESEIAVERGVPREMAREQTAQGTGLAVFAVVGYDRVVNRRPSCRRKSSLRLVQEHERIQTAQLCPSK